jgi:hypothetical protein
MRCAAALLLLAFAAPSSLSQSHEADGMNAEDFVEEVPPHGEQVPPEENNLPPEEDMDDIMAELAREREAQEAADEQAKAEARALRDQKRHEAKLAKEIKEESKLGAVVTEIVAHGEAAKLFSGDDPVAAAFRWCEKRSRLEKTWLLGVTEQFTQALAGNVPDYTPAEDTVLKSAGKHGKRAKEHSKDGEYDLAAMDLLRAMGRKVSMASICDYGCVTVSQTAGWTAQI